ncbi:MAG: BlaI/MecI/CopY family transcriptional regulator [Solirubrobacteraceae bacterium]
MTDAPLQGDLQLQIMSVLWHVGEGTVEQVRAALAPRHRSAYNTVQTVLNRLTERGLLSRKREGHAMVYRATLSEAEYLSRAIERTLAGASSEARQVALAQLVGAIDGEELAELQKLAKQAQAGRARRR